MNIISIISKLITSNRRVILFLGGATIVSSLLGMGSLWVVSMIPADKLPNARAAVPPVVVSSSIPRQASVPWRRQIGSAQPISLSTARIPWVRSTIQSQTDFPEKTSHSPPRIEIPIAQVPWKKAK